MESCRMFFAIALLVAAVLSASTVYAEEKSAVATDETKVAQALNAPPPAWLLQIAGKYRGDVELNNGNDAFQLTLSQDGKKISGVSQFFKGDLACQAPANLTATVVDEESMAFTTADALRGCERTFRVKVVSDTEMAGVLVGPNGTFKIRLKKN